MVEEKEMTKQEIIAEEKELFKQQFKADFSNAKEELARSEKNYAEHKEILDMMKEVFDSFKNAKEVIINKCEVIEPVYEYERDPVYKEYYKKLLTMELQQKYHEFLDVRIPGLEKTVRFKKEAIDSLKEKISKMEEEKND